MSETIEIVDDDCDTRVLLRDCLEFAGFDVTEAASGVEAVESAVEGSPAMVILDVRMPGLSGYEVCHDLRDKLGPNVPIMFLSGERVESFDRVAGLLLGADDYMVKPFALDELVTRVRRLVSSSVSTVSTVEAKLTCREFEVLQLLAQGRSQRDIAADLFISPKTVGTHVERILSKLGVHSRAQAVALAYRDGGRLN